MHSEGRNNDEPALTRTPALPTPKPGRRQHQTDDRSRLGPRRITVAAWRDMRTLVTPTQRERPAQIHDDKYIDTCEHPLNDCLPGSEWQGAAIDLHPVLSISHTGSVFSAPSQLIQRLTYFSTGRHPEGAQGRGTLAP
eukprot:scaffold192881_cov52-Prasinocladus_malaysianus.AAC.1